MSIAQSDTIVGHLCSLLPSWKRHLRAANLADRTIQSYLEAANQLAAFLEDRGMPTAVASIRREHIETYMALCSTATRQVPPLIAIDHSNSYSGGWSMTVRSPHRRWST